MTMPFLHGSAARASSPRILFSLWKPLPGNGVFAHLIPRRQIPRPSRASRKKHRPAMGQTAFCLFPAPFFPFSARASPLHRNPFFPPEPCQIDLSVHPSPLRLRNSPPEDSSSDGQVCLTGFQTPAPVTRVPPWKPSPGEAPPPRPFPHGGIPRPRASRPRSPRRARGIRSGCARRASRAPWEGGPTEEGKSICTTLRARAYAYARARPPLREREPLKNNLL